MEWNARSQITTWYPPPNAASLVARDGDYARKHWAGLVADYYAARVDAVLAVALGDAAAGRPLNATAVAAAEAAHAWAWVHNTSAYPLLPAPGALQVAAATRAAVAPYYAACGGNKGGSS
jgi:hypothetical protein